MDKVYEVFIIYQTLTKVFYMIDSQYSEETVAKEIKSLTKFADW